MKKCKHLCTSGVDPRSSTFFGKSTDIPQYWKQNTWIIWGSQFALLYLSMVYKSTHLFICQVWQTSTSNSSNHTNFADYTNTIPWQNIHSPYLYLIRCHYDSYCTLVMHMTYQTIHFVQSNLSYKTTP